jgi:NTE family protein
MKKEPALKGLKIGIALSGGTAKTVAHIGVLKALTEQGIKIDYISGTSGGAIVAAFFAAGRSIGELERLGSAIRWRDIARPTIPRLGLLSGDKLREFIVAELGNIEFKDLALPLAVVAADLSANTGRVFTSGAVAVACQASSSIPEFYTPVELEEHVLIDGQFSEYVPVAALRSLGDMFAIGVNLGYEKGMKRKPRNAIELVIQLSSFIAQQNASASERLADFMIHPDMRGFGPLELNKASDIIRLGYTEALRIMPELKAAITARKSAR